ADGAVVVKHGQGRPLRHIEVVEAAHPVPDPDSLRGGLRLLGIAEQAQPADLVIALITGGSSALAIAPAEGISFDDKVATNRLLLASGADIVSINNVRKHLSRIKGGLLAAACGCEVLNVSVSDVVGDPPDYFTDLTVPDRSTFAMAQAVCDRFGLWDRLPAAVATRLRRADPAQETPKAIERITTVVVANSAMMCEAAAGEAGRRGYDARVVTLELEGEATAAGAWLADELERAPAQPDSNGHDVCLIAGGENTVTLDGPGAAPDSAGPSAAAGVGGGGPNQEAALAAAAPLAAAGFPAAVLCLDSDGTDGPTDAAGGLADDLTVERAQAAGVDLGDALRRHDTRDCLAALGDLVVTGPTGTNVNDLKLALRAATPD
ncbi:MAG TPA: DUF4147 domain-containing protein, partial [Thermoleophilia bacterium]|nr:DUF4147 domain-containing protein [Thermoleophilia bacterium]